MTRALRLTLAWRPGAYLRASGGLFGWAAAARGGAA